MQSVNYLAMQCNAGTFLSEQGTGMVVVSAQGYQETARFFDLHQWAADGPEPALDGIMPAGSACD